MNPVLVTGYVPIPNHPRTATEYGELGEKLSGVPVKKKAFYMKVEDTWMAKYIRGLKFDPSPSQHDNSEKNTTAYHCVNHMKTSWLVQAADENPDADVLVWVDYGIFRLPGINNQAIYEFMNKIDDKAIYAPGCWQQQDAVESAYPCWRFCGSVLAVPRKMVDSLDYACRVAARQHIAATRNVEWEVNTWARVEKKASRALPWRWYKADHDVSMFTNLELV
jgi:hypothetical protein